MYVKTTDKCVMFAGLLQEVLYGGMQYSVLANMVEAGSYDTKIFVYIDAYIVYAAISSSETRTPTQAELIYEVRATHGHVVSAWCQRLYRIDTEDMLCDGLTKGVIVRSAILTATSSGRLSLQKPFKCWPFARPSQPAVSTTT